MKVDKIKDYLGFKRLFTVDVYGVGYMSNRFHIKRIEIYNSKKFILKHGLSKVAFSQIRIKKLTFPFTFSSVVNKNK